MKLSEELTWRGLVNQTTYQDLTQLDNGAVTFYWGVDPSADSMTIGNLAAAMMVKCFIKHGHQPVLLVGGATGMIGDPDGKKSERDLLSTDDIARNKEAIAAQYRQLYDGLQFKIVDNYDWFKDFKYLDFLRDIGKHVPVSQMLGREFVQSRLGADGSGLSYAEFSYVLIQAYDFVHLFDEHGVTLQVCGADQWGNSIAGVDLIRRLRGQEAHVYSTPLIVNKATGVKFGKSEAGAIWLDPAKTSPTDFYQFWINLDDGGLEDYIKVYTELDKDAVDALMAQHRENPAARVGQTRLAEEVTRLVHGQAAVDFAKEVTDFLIGAKPIGEASEEILSEVKKQLKTATSTPDGSIIDALEASGLAGSKSEARRLLQDKAIYVNGQRPSGDSFNAADFQNGRLMLRRGKAYKDSAVITL